MKWDSLPGATGTHVRAPGAPLRLASVALSGLAYLRRARLSKQEPEKQNTAEGTGRTSLARLQMNSFRAGGAYYAGGGSPKRG